MCLTTRRDRMPSMTKTCRDCKRELPVDDFYLVSKSGPLRRPECISCNLKYQRSRYNPLRKKAEHLKSLYGITLEEFYSKLEEQNYKCAICEIDTPSGNGSNFYVDHNHTTGQIRSLLCHHCNMLIGHAKEDKKILLDTVQYLAKWEALQSQRS
jgi:hypothetical protein